MLKFKQIREAAENNAYAIGMAAAKKKAGYGAGPVENLPKKVIVKAHEIAKKIKANESFDAELDDLEVELFIENMTTEDAQAFMESEEFNQLDEISKKTLASYVTKAADSARDKALDAGFNSNKHQAVKDFVKSAKRVKGISVAAKKLATEEVDQLDELSKATLGSYIKKASKDAALSRAVASSYFQKGYTKSVGPKKGPAAAVARDRAGKRYDASNKRLANVAKATDRLTNEDVEQVDELNKATLANYVKKASHDAALRARFDDRDSPKAPAKAVKRLGGIAKASDKLAKE